MLPISGDRQRQWKTTLNIEICPQKSIEKKNSSSGNFNNIESREQLGAFRCARTGAILIVADLPFFNFTGWTELGLSAHDSARVDGWGCVLLAYWHRSSWPIARKASAQSLTSDHTRRLRRTPIHEWHERMNRTVLLVIFFTSIDPPEKSLLPFRLICGSDNDRQASIKSRAVFHGKCAFYSTLIFSVKPAWRVMDNSHYSSWIHCSEIPCWPDAESVFLSNRQRI